MQSRSKLSIPLIGAALACGCGKPPETVYVDPASVPDLRAGRSVPGKSLSASSGGMARTEAAIPASSLRLDRTSALRSSAKELETERKRSLRRLVSLFEELRNSEIDQTQSGLQRGLTLERDRRIAMAEFPLRQLFNSYADDRGPMLIRLSVLDAEAFFNAESAYATRRKESKASTQRLLDDQLDTYLKQRAGILAGINEWYEAQLTRIQSDIAIQRIKASDDAAAKAESMLDRGLSQAGVPKEGLVTRVLAPVASRSIIVPGSTFAGAADGWTDLPGAPSEAVSAQSTLKLWAATRGYTLSTRRVGHRDATQEFRSWLKDRRLGP